MVPLSAEYFEMRLGLEPGEIAAITITSLPQEGSGKLMLDGVEVQVHDTIFRSELTDCAMCRTITPCRPRRGGLALSPCAPPRF